MKNKYKILFWLLIIIVNAIAIFLISISFLTGPSTGDESLYGITKIELSKRQFYFVLILSSMATIINSIFLLLLKPAINLKKIRLGNFIAFQCLFLVCLYYLIFLIVYVFTQKTLALQF